MVKLAPSPEIEALVQAVRSFADTQIRPHVGTSTTPDQVVSRIVTGLGQMGLTSPAVEEFGGQGLLEPLELILVAEELAMADAGVALDVMMGAHAATLVARCGTDEQRAFAASLDLGDDSQRGTMLLYEGFGRGPEEWETSLEPDGDACSIRGRKVGVIRPATAAFGVVVGTTAGQLGAVLVPGGSLSAERVVRDDRDHGILGLRTAHTGIVEFDGGSVPESRPLACGGLPLAREVASARLSVAAIAVGVAKQALAYATGYAAHREAFGHAIAGFQGVAFPLADVAMLVESAALGIRDVVVMLERTTDDAALTRSSTSAVQRAMTAADQATRTAINTLGGHGYLEDHPVERYYRDASTLSALDFDILAAGSLSTS